MDVATCGNVGSIGNCGNDLTQRMLCAKDGDDMTSILIDEFVNGFSVAIYDHEENYVVREVTETRLEALKVLQNTVEALMVKEREKILNATMLQH